MSDVIVTVGEEGNPPVVIITPGETILPTASVQVQTQEEVPVVHITVDENSAQSAADSAEEVKAILEGLQSGPFVEKAEFAESNMTGDSYVHFSLPHYSSLRFVGDSTVFKGVYLFPGYKSYSGKKLTLKNFQTTDILLKHLANDPLLNTNLYFPNETDYILKPGKIIEFSLSMIANRFEFIGDSEDVSGKEDKSNKGIADGYVPLNSAVKIASEYLSIVNDLISGGTTSLLSAEQGKQLKIQVNAINTLLTSDNVNLDSLQELVDAIETVQTSLSTILVNDLTTGGVTKALTAEMGKSLKVLIDDLTTIASGKQANLTDVNFGLFQSALPTVITIADTDKIPFLIGSLSRMMTWASFKAFFKTINGNSIFGSGNLTITTGVTRTLKTITSANLATQDATGFVSYINSLAVLLVVGANEIVEYQLTDTGRIFNLLLNGRSFGVGQPAITTANVEEVTLWMNKDLKLSNYPSTRNDGQLSSNKVLSTDVNGNLKLYSMAVLPAPYMEILIPDSTLPSITTNFTIKGAFFTPTMTVAIVGQTINYITFVSDNLIKVNVTTGATEGSYAVTLNNGLSAIFPNALLIVLGTIFSPLTADWEAPTGNVDAIDDCVKVKIYEVTGSNRWNKQFDYTRNFRVNFKIAKTPYGYTNNNEYHVEHITLVKSSNNATLFSINLIRESSGWATIHRFSQATGWVANVVFANASTPSVNMDVICSKNYEFRYISGIMYFYVDGVLKATFSDPITENLKLKISTKTFDILNIKYVETA